VEPPSASWRMIRSQSNERPARRSRRERRALRRSCTLAHMRRRWHRTYRRRRPRRPRAARLLGPPRSRERSSGARRARAHAAGEARASEQGRRAPDTPRSPRSPSRAPAQARRLAATRARDRPGPGPARRPTAARRPRRRRPPRLVQADGVPAPSRRGRTLVPGRRRGSRRGRSRRRAAFPCTPHTAAPAMAPASHSARRRAAGVASGTRRISRRARCPAPRRSRTARVERDRAGAPSDGRPSGLTAPCQPCASSLAGQTGGAETSSRRSSWARSRSAGVLIGEKRPRGPRRGTSRYCAGTNADTSW
jgi:hypothetical protein